MWSLVQTRIILQLDCLFWSQFPTLLNFAVIIFHSLRFCLKKLLVNKWNMVWQNHLNKCTIKCTAEYIQTNPCSWEHNIMQNTLQSNVSDVTIFTYNDMSKNIKRNINISFLKHWEIIIDFFHGANLYSISLFEGNRNMSITFKITTLYTRAHE